MKRDFWAEEINVTWLGAGCAQCPRTFVPTALCRFHLHFIYFPSGQKTGFIFFPSAEKTRFIYIPSAQKKRFIYFMRYFIYFAFPLRYADWHGLNDTSFISFTLKNETSFIHFALKCSFLYFLSSTVPFHPFRFIFSFHFAFLWRNADRHVIWQKMDGSKFERKTFSFSCAAARKSLSCIWLGDGREMWNFLEVFIAINMHAELLGSFYKAFRHVETLYQT